MEKKIITSTSFNTVGSCYKKHWFSTNGMNVRRYCVIPTKCCQYPPLQFLWTKIRSTWPDNDRHWLQRSFLAHFRRKMAQLCLWTKIRTKQWFVLGTSAFQCMCAAYLCPKCDNFACLHIRQDQNELHLFFFCQNITMIFKVMLQYFPALSKRIHNHFRSADKTNYLLNLLKFKKAENFLVRINLLERTFL